MKIFLTVMLCLLALLAVLLIYVSWLLFSMACARKIPRIISPLMSKLIGGLFFAGEIIDVDAYTGGFNLQIAFSTGFLAGENAARYEREV